GADPQGRRSPSPRFPLPFAPLQSPLLAGSLPALPRWPPAMSQRNATLGLWMFAIYLVLYGGFVLLNALSPETMEWTPFTGINLAVAWGFGLILAAIVLAFLYGYLCRETGTSPRVETRP
ncbi:MAG: DUF485 domain-containing protein, partial [Planctomycetaceae bacterium]